MRAILWFAAFTAIQFVAWLVYYKADSDCPDPVMASCYPVMNTVMMVIVMIVLYGSAIVSAKFRRPVALVTDDDEPLIAAYKIGADRRWGDPVYYWRFVTLASLPIPFVFALIRSSAQHRRTSTGFLMVLEPVLAMSAIELWRFLRAATRDKE